ncbi:MAG: intradiol ring-cleavage dioxygenase [Rudaea sp.]|uniref:intradiol ring-cleavage dioxygenase n=1 Tax=Rudaea sp. TaxID=2136325 RepID=UPI0039E47262
MPMPVKPLSPASVFPPPLKRNDPSPPAMPARRRMLSAFGALSALPLLGDGVLRLKGETAQAATTGSAAPNIDQQGLTGAWYDPTTSGQGMLIEVIPDESYLFGAWFTYDTTAGDVTTQRWYTFGGTISDGANSATLTIWKSSGGKFNSLPKTYAIEIGTATLSFDSCTSGSFAFTLDDGTTGTIPLTRLLQNVACTSADTTAASDVADFALSGAWYNADTSGQGLVIEVNSVYPYVFFGWFTYSADGATDDDAGFRWMTGQSVDYAAGDDTINLNLYIGTNGTFNSSATKVSATQVGTATLTYSSCGSAVLSYDFTAGELASQSGSIALTRTGATPAACVFGSTCALTASETDGPYPLYSILSNSAIVRSDITEGYDGIPLTLTLTLVDVNDSCAPISNAAIYIWHCDALGDYSGYANQESKISTVGDTFLRGIQVTDAKGQVTFQTIYPGWYTGRITHIHVQAYLNDKLTQGTAVITTQLAFPQDITTAVYNTTYYTSHGQNTVVSSFAKDNVFSDGTTTEMLTISGDVTNGYVASLTLGIDA